jgi:ribosomal protein S18 acetylase RimI-like enzyme
VRADDVEAVRRRQRVLGVPESFEWVAEVTPSLRPAAERAGLEVHEHPLMVLDAAAFAAAAAPLLPAGVRVRIVDPEEPDLATLRALADVGFGSPGTAIGGAGREALAAAAGHLDAAGVAALRERLRTGATVMAAAGDREGPLAVGSHQPIGDVTEVVGVATLPAARRRGLAAAVTHALVADALRRGCEVVFLSAGDDAVARIYGRLGFRRAATALIAEPPAPATV